jgi:diaminohydroxyphosphoribosylaminopyrimidine deaminase/5-amino-6-(5-phosphoribosylamino)uracil reductase
MDLCLKEAWKYQGLTYPNPAVGSLILDENGKLLAISAHCESGSAHAELSVIAKTLSILRDKQIDYIDDIKEKHQYILENHNNLFLDFTIYVTLEPCNHQGKTPPCSTLIKTLGFKKVVIGKVDPNPKATGSIFEMEEKGIEVIKGVLQNRCDELLKPFKKWQKNEPYIFFKLATTQNGVYTGGVISSLASRTLVHKLREKIDLLVVGGNTVRMDKPTLDCRLTASGMAPDVLIYSKSDSFDRKIPLFNVKNREVFIESTLDKLKNYKFIMIEGGEGMLEVSLEIIDNILLFTSPDFKEGKTVHLDFKLKSIFQDKIAIDTIEWFKKI